ncbi:MAG: hypothetical protein H0W96_13725 [Solirubrobacterales bacterium]|nr:hypothetical protein [Solirubrobacterales bacterium]
MLSLAALAALALPAVVLSTGVAQGAVSKARITQGVVYGGVNASSGYPVVIELSKTGRKVVKATMGLELKCTMPGDVTVPDTFKNLPVSKTGKFAFSYGPEEFPATDPASGVSKYQAFGSITGTVNKAKTRIVGTWSAKVVAYAASDPTGATVLDTCDSGTLSYRAKQ